MISAYKVTHIYKNASKQVQPVQKTNELDQYDAGTNDHNGKHNLDFREILKKELEKKNSKKSS